MHGEPPAAAMLTIAVPAVQPPPRLAERPGRFRVPAMRMPIALAEPARARRLRGGAALGAVAGAILRPPARAVRPCL